MYVIFWQADSNKEPGPSCRSNKPRLRVLDRGVHRIADDVEPARVPRVRHPAVGEIGERHAGLRIGPAIRRADAAMAERAWRGDRAKATDRRRRPARMRAEPAMHRHAHVVMDPVAGE